MSIKNIFSLTTSIISLFIFILFSNLSSNSDENNIKYYSNDEGILSIMYHRFNESKYPSTNIQMDIFKQQIEIIEDSNYKFNNPSEFEKMFSTPKIKKEILITIDDAFLSFYQEAWPFLKKNKIPFILFVSTEPVGKRGYMTWSQIREVESEDFAFIGHHSHTHDYLINETNDQFISDIEKANKIFLKELGYIPNLFSYPFGEYSKFMRNYISKNFKFAFGQHSGVIDLNKDKFELPRFPINEKYGELKRFKSIINYFPLEYKEIFPKEKYLSQENNPPKFEVKFFKEQKKLDNINCYSNEGNKWEKSKTNFSNYTLTIKFREPFVPRRGRINCSLNDNGKWRWFGIQFPIKEN
ncbi:polysaccharide deacetylase family protein [Candidatus Pelagibacter sp. HTCC7211]|uniref:polysaccharide deacetylase family protein n=1 Tax=Pelagibacter sp. (strain HTCC7211) TaxID=439493 RepID=UPI001E2A3AE2|nr:polysaccharide deacetylase family protein [Candidatus Pelagibacter sp. HTCC7211]